MMFGFLKRKSSVDRDMPINRRRPSVATSEERQKLSLSPSPLGETIKNAQKESKARFAARHALRFLYAAAVTAGIIFLGIAGYRHAVTSDYFKFAEANISGNERLKNEDILKIAGLVLGANIFETDIVDARIKLLENPWIEDAEVVRHLPGSIIIRVQERKARALVNLDVLYLVDDTGKVFKRWVRGDPIAAPVITGISREEYILSQSAVEAVLCDAIDLADRYAATGLDRIQPLQEIYREPDMGFSLTVGEDPTYVKFGKGPYKTKLMRLAALLSRLRGEQKRPRQIFFDNEIRPDRITVKLKGEPANKESADNDDAPSIETKKIVSKI